jgi:hypothetical protein
VKKGGRDLRDAVFARQEAEEHKPVGRHVKAQQVGAGAAMEREVSLAQPHAERVTIGHFEPLSRQAVGMKSRQHSL